MPALRHSCLAPPPSQSSVRAKSSTALAARGCSRRPARLRHGRLAIVRHGSHAHTHHTHTHDHHHNGHHHHPSEHDHSHGNGLHSSPGLSNGSSQVQAAEVLGQPAGPCPICERAGELGTPSNPIHRALRVVFKYTGIRFLFDLLNDRTWAAAIIAALGLSAGGVKLASVLHWAPAMRAQQGVEIATYGTLVLAGIPALVELCFDVTSGHVDTHVLMTLAVMGTMAMGAASEGALLLGLFNISHVVETSLSRRAQGDLTSLYDQIPSTAVIVALLASGAPDMSTASTRPASDVPVGAHMLVRPGQQVALDGVVTYGASLVSLEHITGESIPARCEAGQALPAGARNHDGVLVVQATEASANSTPARIARLTLSAQSQRPQLGQWLDRFGEAYSKCVLAATFVALAGLPLLGVPLHSTPTQVGAVYRAMGLLTTASPCALVLVPMAYVAAIAAISFRGMLIKGGRVLDALTHVSTVAFDKTGTLTTGLLKCTSMLGLDSMGQTLPPSDDPREWISQGGRDEDALKAAIALSQLATHPISECVVGLRDALPRGSLLPHVTDFQLRPGGGVQGLLDMPDGRWSTRFGSYEYACKELPREHALRVSAAAGRIVKGSIISVLVACKPGCQPVVRFFTFADSVHERSAAAVAALSSGAWTGRTSPRDGLKIVMLTGDSQESAKRVAHILGISNVAAGLSPEEKLQRIHAARASAGQSNQNRSGVIMVGDGINDAPALAAADVGIAVTHTMSDAAAGTADVVLLRNDGIAGLPMLLHIAQRTQRILRQNLFLALASIAALALPMLMGRIPLWMAVMGHEGSTLLVALNCLRLLRAPTSSPATPSGALRNPLGNLEDGQSLGGPAIAASAA